MQNYIKDLIGRSKANAIDKLEHDEKSYRIVREDNTPYIITCDFESSRLNLEIENGIVVDVGLG